MSGGRTDSGSGLVWAIDLGGTNTKLGIVAAGGEVIGEESLPTRSERSAESWADEVAAALRAIGEREGVDERSIGAVGIGSPGPLSVKEGVLTNPLPNLPKWRGFPICAALSERLGKPAFLDNDANAAALSEQWLGVAQGSDNVVVLTLGTGIGGGVIAEGRLLHGFSDNAGELGHISIDHDGPQCACGSRGCIELYASAGATAERYRRKLIEAGREAETEITAEGVFEAAEAGDDLAKATFAEVGQYLGAAVGGIVHAFNPEMVVVAGGMAEAAPYFLETIRSVVKERTFPDLQAGLRIEVSPLGDRMGLLGAARLAFMAADGE
jgi:glucokinase